jgi:hypothetical protein
MAVNGRDVFSGARIGNLGARIGGPERVSPLSSSMDLDQRELERLLGLGSQPMSRDMTANVQMGAKESDPTPPFTFGDARSSIPGMIAEGAAGFIPGAIAADLALATHSFSTGDNVGAGANLIAAIPGVPFAGPVIKKAFRSFMDFISGTKGTPAIPKPPPYTVLERYTLDPNVRLQMLGRGRGTSRAGATTVRSMTETSPATLNRRRWLGEEPEPPYGVAKPKGPPRFSPDADVHVVDLSDNTAMFIDRTPPRMQISSGETPVFQGSIVGRGNKSDVDLNFRTRPVDIVPGVPPGSSPWMTDILPAPRDAAAALRRDQEALAAAMDLSVHDPDIARIIARNANKEGVGELGIGGIRRGAGALAEAIRNEGLDVTHFVGERLFGTKPGRMQILDIEKLFPKIKR